MTFVLILISSFSSGVSVIDGDQPNCVYACGLDQSLLYLPCSIGSLINYVPLHSATKTQPPKSWTNNYYSLGPSYRYYSLPINALHPMGLPTIMKTYLLLFIVFERIICLSLFRLIEKIETLFLLMAYGFFGIEPSCQGLCDMVHKRLGTPMHNPCPEPSWNLTKYHATVFPHFDAPRSSSCVYNTVLALSVDVVVQCAKIGVLKVHVDGCWSYNDIYEPKPKFSSLGGEGQRKFIMSLSQLVWEVCLGLLNRHSNQYVPLLARLIIFMHQNLNKYEFH